MSTRAIKGAEVGFSNSRNVDSLTGVCKTLREKRVGRIQKYELAESMNLPRSPPFPSSTRTSGVKWCEANVFVCWIGFWFLVSYATTQLATQLRQRCIQVVRSNKEARKRLTESNVTTAMDFGCEKIRKHKYTQTKNRTKHTITIVN